MKSILVPVEEHVLMHSVLETALHLARALDGYLEGMAITPNLPPYIASDLAIGDISFLDPEVRRQQAEASRRGFESFMKARGVPRSEAGSSGLCFSWCGGDLAEDDFVGHYGRAFDITVLGRPSDQPDHPRLPTVEAALFESGRPVLLVPPGPAATLGTTVVIAWNRSTETARTVALAMPLLAKAQRVVVIDFEDWGVSGPSTEDLSHTLARNGLPVETRTVPNPHGHTGEAILSAAGSLGCDLLVKGAYTQSRLRQFIFGGATSHILSNTTVPLLMAHSAAVPSPSRRSPDQQFVCRRRSRGVYYADAKQPRHAAPVDQDMPRDAGNPLPHWRPVMTIAPTLQKYMDEQGIRYELVPHEPSLSALGSAHAGHIPGDRLAKAVVLNDGGRYKLAVLPASHHLRLSDLRTELGHEIHLATEPEAAGVFRDCAFGAIPAVGACYGLDVIIDTSIDQQQELYFEGGDHATLVHVNGAEFARLNPQAQHGSFSGRA